MLLAVIATTGEKSERIALTPAPVAFFCQCGEMDSLIHCQQLDEGARNCVNEHARARGKRLTDEFEYQTFFSSVGIQPVLVQFNSISLFNFL